MKRKDYSLGAPVEVAECSVVPSSLPRLLLVMLVMLVPQLSVLQEAQGEMALPVEVLAWFPELHSEQDSVDAEEPAGLIQQVTQKSPRRWEHHHPYLARSFQRRWHWISLRSLSSSLQRPSSLVHQLHHHRLAWHWDRGHASGGPQVAQESRRRTSQTRPTLAIWLAELCSLTRAL